MTQRYQVTYGFDHLRDVADDKDAGVELTTLFSDMADVTVVKLMGRGRFLSITAPEESYPKLKERVEQNGCLISRSLQMSNDPNF